MRGPLDNVFVGDASEAGPRFAQTVLHLLLRVGWAEKSPLHQITAVGFTLLAKELVPYRERCTDRAPRIAGRRLHPDLPEGAIAQDLAVGDAIESNAARKA